MTTLAGFLQTVCDDPADVDTRLIFADWLTDQSDPALSTRGEFLRLQTRLAGWVPDLEERQALQSRARALRTAHAEDWLGPLHGLALDWSLDSGLTRVTLDCDAFLHPSFAAQAEELLARACVECVRLAGVPGHLTALTQASHLEAVLGLDLADTGLRDPDAAALARCPHLKNLRRLDLANSALADTAAAAQAGTPHLGQLAGLDLRNNALGPAGAHALLTSNLPRLRRLELHGNDLEPELLQLAARWHQDRGSVSQRDGLPVRVVNAIGMELVLVPPGTFLMGSPEDEPEREACEGPRHTVTITRRFYLGAYPVTQRQYAAVTNDRPAYFTAGQGGGEEHPVERVTWADAERFCQLLTALPAEKAAGRRYRLPTEAEWEHACRAGTATAFAFGPALLPWRANFDARASYAGSPVGAFPQRTTRVGAYPPNAFGLFDLHGNVWEWCADYFDQTYYKRSPAADPTGPATGNRVSVRGGSWLNTAAYCRSATRDYWYGYHYQRNTIGFRVAMTAEAP
jgi:uncharacterized protein (TIGR02996 family)